LLDQDKPGQEQAMQHKCAIGTSPFFAAAMKKPLLAAWLFAAATVAIGGAVLCGPAVRASIERQRAEEIERENGEVCTSLGMTSASRHSICAEALTRLRRLHEERLSRDSIL
jgi:hypothetical protein